MVDYDKLCGKFNFCYVSSKILIRRVNVRPEKISDCINDYLFGLYNYKRVQTRKGRPDFYCSLNCYYYSTMYKGGKVMDMQHCDFDEATPKDCVTCWDFEECPCRKRSGSVLGWYFES